MQLITEDQINLAVSLNAMLDEMPRKNLTTILKKVRDIYDAPNQSWVWFVPYRLLGLRSRTSDIDVAVNAFEKTQQHASIIFQKLFSVGNWKETSANTLIMRELIDAAKTNHQTVFTKEELQTIKILLTMAQKIKVQIQIREYESVRSERNAELIKIAQESATKKAKENLAKMFEIKMEPKPEIKVNKLNPDQVAFAKILKSKLEVGKVSNSEALSNAVVIEDYAVQSEAFKQKAQMLSQLFIPKVMKQLTDKIETKLEANL